MSLGATTAPSGSERLSRDGNGNGAPFGPDRPIPDNTVLLTNERMLPPTHPFDQLVDEDFRPTMEELHILGRIQPHGFLIAVQEGDVLLLPPTLAAGVEADAEAISRDEAETDSASAAASASATASPGLTGSGRGTPAASSAPMSPLLNESAPPPLPTAPAHDPAHAFPIRIISWNTQNLFLRSSEQLLGAPLASVLGAAQVARLQADLASCRKLADIQAWPCAVQVRRAAVASEPAVQDVLRDRRAEEIRVDMLEAARSASRCGLDMTHPRGVSSPAVPDPLATPLAIEKITPSPSPTITLPVPALPNAAPPASASASAGASQPYGHEDPHYGHALRLARELPEEDPEDDAQIPAIETAVPAPPRPQQENPAPATPAAPPSGNPYAAAASTGNPYAAPSAGNPYAAANPFAAAAGGGDAAAAGGPPSARSAPPSFGGGGGPPGASGPPGSGGPPGAGGPPGGGPPNFGRGGPLPPPVRLPTLPFPRPGEPTLPELSGPLTLQAYDVCFHRSGGLLVLEFEPSNVPAIAVSAQAAFRRQMLRSIAIMQSAHSFQDCVRRCAREVRRIAGYDRAMVYRFLPDGSGEVIAESKTAAFPLDSFLGLLYPASDIPPQARALYVRNRFRLIGDSSFRGVSLLPQINPLTHAPVDLTYAGLRSVHPIHLQYLRNMGVRGSLSISIVINGQLWGLIALHHYRSSRYLDYESRSICEQLGELMATQIPHHLQRERVAHSASLRASLDLVLHSISSAGREADLQAAAVAAAPLRPATTAKGSRNGAAAKAAPGVQGLWATALAAQHEVLLRLFDSTGVVIVADGKMSSVGRVPEPAQLLPLTAFLISQAAGTADPAGVWSTNALSKVFPAAAAYALIASGCLAILLSALDGDLIVFFRPEIVSTVAWGGPPVDSRGQEWLTPRNSFAVWKSLQQGCSREWDPACVDIAVDLRRFLLEVKLIYLAREGEAAERTKFLYAEEMRRKQIDFVDKICHEIRNPINGVVGCIALMREELAEMEALLRGVSRGGNGAAGPGGSPGAEKRSMSDGVVLAHQHDGLAAIPSAVVSSVSSVVASPATTGVAADFAAAGAGASASVVPPSSTVSSRSLPTATLLSHLDELHENLNNIDECVQHQKIIADDVLGLSKLEHARVKLDLSPFDLAECVQKSLAMYAAVVKLKGLRLTLDYACTATHIRGDATRLKQILANILSNAVKFTAKGEIAVSVVQMRPQQEEESERKTGATAITVSSPSAGTGRPRPLAEFEIRIRDTGIGMSNAQINALFQPYSQASNKTALVYGGSGLGLCIARELARLMGGDLSVTSTPGVGSEFCLSLLAEPLTEQEAAQWLERDAAADEVARALFLSGRSSSSERRTTPDTRTPTGAAAMVGSLTPNSKSMTATGAAMPPSLADEAHPLPSGGSRGSSGSSHGGTPSAAASDPAHAAARELLSLPRLAKHRSMSIDSSSAVVTPSALPMAVSPAKAAAAASAAAAAAAATTSTTAPSLPGSAAASAPISAAWPVLSPAASSPAASTPTATPTSTSFVSPSSGLPPVHTHPHPHAHSLSHAPLRAHSGQQQSPSPTPQMQTPVAVRVPSSISTSLLSASPSSSPLPLPPDAAMSPATTALVENAARTVRIASTPRTAHRRVLQLPAPGGAATGASSASSASPASVSSSPAPPGAAAAGASARPFPDWSPRCLMLEDNSINARVLQRTLQNLGCTVQWAVNGLEGVRMFREARNGDRPFEIVFSDVEMPIMGGLEATQRMRQIEREDAEKAAQPASVPEEPASSSGWPASSPPAPRILRTYIACVSGNVRDEFVQAAHFAGVDSYIGKPFSRDALVAAIRRARTARDAEAEKAAQMRA